MSDLFRKMADNKYQDQWDDGEDDDDEEDEDDFVPGGDDELEDEYDDDGEDDDDDEEEFPSLLEGQLFRDPSKGMNLCFEQDGVFCLVCQDSVPESFQVSSPVVDVPFKFAGWIKSPATWYEFNFVFTERPETDDPMTLKFLEAQDQLQHRGGDDDAGKNNTSGGKSTGLEEEEEDDDDLDQKAPAKPSPSLKAPPSYADDGKKAAATAGANDTDKKTGFIFSLSATQVGGDKPMDDDNISVTFHGSFRRPRVSDEKIFIICPVILSTNTAGAAAGAAAGSASAAPAAAAAASAGATSRKRGRSALEDEDDVSCVEEDKGNVLNELIGLHDDAHLTTEQLRAKYYGGGGGDQRKPPPAPMSKKSTDDDDDDDDIGF